MSVKDVRFKHQRPIFLRKSMLVQDILGFFMIMMIMMIYLRKSMLIPDILGFFRTRLVSRSKEDR